MEKTHNLTYEKKLVDLLGYKLKKEEDLYIIYDEEDNEVGFIRCRRFNKGQDKTYGYEMFIDSSKIKFHSFRSSKENKTSYQFNIKDENNTKVELDLGKDKLLTIWSNNTFSNLNLNDNRLYLYLEGTTENYKTNETFVYSNKANKSFQYSYQINFSHKEDKTDRGTIEVDGYEIEPNRLKITDITWFYGHDVKSNTTEVEGNIQDMVKKYHYGIDLFNHYHYLVDSILPFKKDVLEEILKDEKGQELFISKNNEKTIRSKAKVTSEEYNKVFAR